MTGSSDRSNRSDSRAVVTPATVFRYVYLRWSAVDRGWKATVIGLLILVVVVQS